MKLLKNMKAIKIGFYNILPEGTNYSDSHKSLPIFRTKWGRGVLKSYDGTITALIGDFTITHAHLKTKFNPGDITIGTFYYGYDYATKCLYLEYASDRTFDLHDPSIFNRIMDALISL